MCGPNLVKWHTYRCELIKRRRLTNVHMALWSVSDVGASAYTACDHSSCGPSWLAVRIMGGHGSPDDVVP